MAIRHTEKTKPVGWSDAETVALAQLYRHFAQLQDEGKLGRGKGKTSKAGLVRAFCEKSGRTRGSVEAKLMNVSAVVRDLGGACSVSLVEGYKPLPNLSRSCRTIISNAFTGEGFAPITGGN